MSLTKKYRAAVSLKTVILLLIIAVLLMQLVGLYVFRFYENELVRKTEGKLIAQAAVVSAGYVQALAREGVDIATLGTALPPDVREHWDPKGYAPVDESEYLFGDGIRGMRPDPVVASVNPSDKVKKAGEALMPLILKTRQVMLAGIKVLDENGVQVAGAKAEQGLSFAHIEEVAKLFKTARYQAVLRERVSDYDVPSLASISRGTGVRIFSVFPVIAQGRLLGAVYLSRTPENIMKFMYQRRVKLAALLAFVLVPVFGLGFLLSYVVLRPVSHLSRHSKKLVSGRMTGTIEPQPSLICELDELSRNVVRMATHLSERSRYIEGLATHVSHEFKTPLTAMRGAAELMAEHADMPESKRAHFLGNILADCDRLQKLVTRLLQLARADMKQVAEPKTCQLEPLLERLQKDYAKKGQTVEINGLGDTTIAGAPDDIRTVFSNLCDNGFAHGASKVVIGKDAGAEAPEGRVALVVENDGEPIRKENRDRIFTPFFTTRRADGGTGLGLQIVLSLLAATEGRIELDKTSEKTRFKLVL